MIRFVIVHSVEPQKSRCGRGLGNVIIFEVDVFSVLSTSIKLSITFVCDENGLNLDYN